MKFLFLNRKRKLTENLDLLSFYIFGYLPFVRWIFLINLDHSNTLPSYGSMYGKVRKWDLIACWFYNVITINFFKGMKKKLKLKSSCSMSKSIELWKQLQKRKFQNMFTICKIWAFFLNTVSIRRHLWQFLYKTILLLAKPLSIFFTSIISSTK